MNNFKNKKIAILGLGIENYALVRFIIKHKVCCKITICDARSKKMLGERYKQIEGEQTFARLQGCKIKWQLGKNYDKNLFDFNVIIRSPGYPLFNKNLAKPKKCKVEITSPIKLFFKLSPSKNIIGVTGTKGKGTVSSLIHAILKKLGKRPASSVGKVWLGGNIGVAPFEFIDKIKKNNWVILELSSFQLEDMHVSPKIAVITNFYKEHLAPADPNNPNYHRSIGEYWQAKSNIFKHQKKDDKLIVSHNLKARLANLANSDCVKYFKKSKLPSKLIGEHNKENIAAAVEVAKIAKVKRNDIKEAVAKFKGLEHRIEFIRSLDGVKYYNDSFATTPESTIIALKSFNAPIVLLAGGADKGAEFKEMTLEMKKRCKAVILLEGEGTKCIKIQISKSKLFQISVFKFVDFKKAVKKAKSIAKKGNIVLLSPGCASFGMFQNYKQRGELFKKYVRELK